MLRSGLLPKDRPGEPFFRWRGGDVSRLEGLTDGVFALAFTLVLLSTEIPRTSTGVLALLRQFPSFAATFAILAMLWWYHYRFHRRFGLEDFTTSVLNLVLLFVLLLYVFPLRYLFGALFREEGYRRLDSGTQADLMMVYGGGYLLIFLLFLALHVHAWRQREALQLDAAELAVTRGAIRAHLLHSAVGAASFGLALYAAVTGSIGVVPYSGFVFFLIGPLQAWNGIAWGREAERLAPGRDGEPEEPAPQT